jgi:hypothetical protein
MMDWYSNYPPPSRETAIKEVIKEVKKNYDHAKLEEICTRVVTDMPSLGSYTGWYVLFQKDAIKEVIKEITSQVPLLPISTSATVNK